MSAQLDFRPDDSHLSWLSAMLTKAAAKAGATVRDEPVLGWRERSNGARVDSPDGPLWLRVVSEQHRWVGGEFWSGNADANTITGAAKPHALRHWEWIDGQYRLRAELMSLAGAAQPPRNCAHRYHYPTPGGTSYALRSTRWPLLAPSGRTCPRQTSRTGSGCSSANESPTPPCRTGLPRTPTCTGRT